MDAGRLDPRHVLRLYDRLGTGEIRVAFFRLVPALCAHLRLTPISVSRGAYSAIHIATKPDAKAYAEAEFAFKGALDHMRWWFRTPAFSSGLLDHDRTADAFGLVGATRYGEMIVDLRNLADVEKMLCYLDAALRQ